MTQKKSTREGMVVGLFQEIRQAEPAIRQLKQEGFSDNQIGVLMQDPERQQELLDTTGDRVSKAAAGGAVGGGVAGGVLGLLAGVGALAIPGVGPIIAGGALASTLAGAGIGAAAGGLIGALVGIGVPEEEAEYFERGIRAGGILVTVDAGSRADEARQILRGRGAELEAGARATTASGKASEDQRSLELREEESRADKEPSEPWRGSERRYHQDINYTGPKRRTADV